MHEEFYVLAAILALAGVAGLLANRMRQPLIVAFIAVGILVGPAAFGWVEDRDEIELLAEVGIAILLFLVGLKLDLKLIRTTGPVAVATGLGQVAFTSLCGFGIALALGFDTTTAIYIAVALTFSSTIIIVKLLSDKRELEAQHGRIAIGFLIVQDIVVVIVMIVLTAVGGAEDEAVLSQMAAVVGKGAGLLIGIGLAMRFLLPRLLGTVARSAELLVLFSVAWAVTLAAASDWLGFSTEVGAFLAGVSLASTSYREAIGARLVSLRDFLLLFFFIQLGAQLAFDDAAGQLSRAAVFSLFVLIGNPLIVLVIMGAMGYRKRTSFLAGLTVAQISEFSLILMALGLSLGHVDSSAVGLVTVVGLITIGTSTYLILYSHQIFERIGKFLSIFERENRIRSLPESEEQPVDVVLYGLGRYGANVAAEMVEAGIPFLAVDSDPQIVARRNQDPDSAFEVVYGDAEDLDFVESLPMGNAEWVVSTIPAIEANLALLEAIRSDPNEVSVAVTAHNDADAERLAAAGADVVLQPFIDAADHVLEILGGDRSREQS